MNADDSSARMRLSFLVRLSDALQNARSDSAADLLLRNLFAKESLARLMP